jgi:hypothetical protein
MGFHLAGNHLPARRSGPSGIGNLSHGTGIGSVIYLVLAEKDSSGSQPAGSPIYGGSGLFSVRTKLLDNLFV